MTGNRRTTEDLIVELAADAAPVRVLPGLVDRIGIWVTPALMSTAVIVALFGLRRDLAEAAGGAGFLLFTAHCVLLAIAAAVGALALAVPGSGARRLGAWAGLLLLGLAAVLGVAASSAGFGRVVHEPWHWPCVARIGIMSAVPAVLLLVMTFRGYVLEPVRAATLAVVAGGAVAMAGLQFVCPIARPSHLLVSHFVPVAALALAAALIARIVSRQH